MNLSEILDFGDKFFLLVKLVFLLILVGLIIFFLKNG